MTHDVTKRTNVSTSGSESRESSDAGATDDTDTSSDTPELDTQRERRRSDPLAGRSEPNRGDEMATNPGADLVANPKTALETNPVTELAANRTTEFEANATTELEANATVGSRASTSESASTDGRKRTGTDETDRADTGTGETIGTDRAKPRGSGHPDVPETAGFRRWVAETSAVLADANSARIEVHLRSMLPPPGAKDAQMDVLEELSAVQDATAIEEVSVSVWGERICLCDRCRETETGRRIVDTVRRYQRWGVEYDASTERFFERKRQHSSLVGNTHEGIAPPRVTAALYVDDSIQGVFPARFEDECYSVHDFSRTLARLTESDRHSVPVE